MQFENQLIFHTAVIIDQSMQLLKLHLTAVVYDKTNSSSSWNTKTNIKIELNLQWN